VNLRSTPVGPEPRRASAARPSSREVVFRHRYPPRSLRVARGAQDLTAGLTGIVTLPRLPGAPARLPAFRPNQELVAAARVAMGFLPTFAQRFRPQPGLSDHFLGYHRLASAPGRASAPRRSRGRPAEPTPGTVCSPTRPPLEKRGLSATHSTRAVRAESRRCRCQAPIRRPQKPFCLTSHAPFEAMRGSRCRAV